MHTTKAPPDVYTKKMDHSLCGKVTIFNEIVLFSISPNHTFVCQHVLSTWQRSKLTCSDRSSQCTHSTCSSSRAGRAVYCDPKFRTNAFCNPSSYADVERCVLHVSVSQASQSITKYMRGCVCWCTRPYHVVVLRCNVLGSCEKLQNSWIIGKRVHQTSVRWSRQNRKNEMSQSEMLTFRTLMSSVKFAALECVTFRMGILHYTRLQVMDTPQRAQPSYLLEPISMSKTKWASICSRVQLPRHRLCRPHWNVYKL